MGRPVKVIFASGSKGKSVLTTAGGDKLSRGWYVKGSRPGGFELVVGPFKTKTEANFKAFGSARP